MDVGIDPCVIKSIGVGGRDFGRALPVGGSGGEVEDGGGGGDDNGGGGGGGDFVGSGGGLGVTFAVCGGTGGGD